MRRRESGYWPRLRELALRGGITMRRVENIVDEGFPDTVWCSRDGGNGVLEVKVADARVRAAPSVAFRPGQVPWLASWAQAGGCCCVVVLFEDFIHVVPGSRALDLMRHGLTEEFRLQGFSAYAINAHERLRVALHAREVTHGRSADRVTLAHEAAQHESRLVAQAGRSSTGRAVLPHLSRRAR